jgi:DNA segregation ATPase FtsK/SpoIIIE, S-DNA-T family
VAAAAGRPAHPRCCGPVLRALAPVIRPGLVQVFGIDPKGGMELGHAPGLFQWLACTNGADAVELLDTSPS